MFRILRFRVGQVSECNYLLESVLTNAEFIKYLRQLVAEKNPLRTTELLQSCGEIDGLPELISAIDSEFLREQDQQALGYLR